jgi:hydroxyacylglutathione hydrolase
MSTLQAVIVPVTAFQQNCTILFDDVTKKGVVVDPGGDVDKIISALVKYGIEAEAIWLTHGHLDHAGGAMDLKAKLNIDILGPHKDDEPLLKRIETQAAKYGLAGDMKNATSDRYLDDGDVVSFSGHDFEVFHTPGHAPGHVIFYNRAAGFAHVGDVLFQGSVGRTDLPGGDHQTLMNSIATKVLPLGDHVGFICGHGPGGRIGEERRTNPYLAGMR